jgi:hypothetical protein
MSDPNEPLVIEVRGKLYRLQIEDFDTDLDLDDIVGIDYTNIRGELLTFPIVYNRIGIFKAEMSNAAQRAKMNVEIVRSQLNQHYRTALTEEGRDYKGKPKTIKPTVDEISAAIVCDDAYQKAYEDYLNAQRRLDYMESIYWACQSKDQKLNRLSEKLRPEEFEQELLVDKVNSVLIKGVRKAIK